MYSVKRICSVPMCGNTSVRNPKKLFVFVPRKESIREKWFQLAKLDATVPESKHIYFCEDHFDMPNDMANYLEYNLIGFVTHMKMRPGCMPSRFECQADARKRKSDAEKLPNTLKKQRKTLNGEREKDSKERAVATEQVGIRETPSGSSVPQAHVDHIRQDAKTAYRATHAPTGPILKHCVNPIDRHLEKMLSKRK